MDEEWNKYRDPEAMTHEEMVGHVVELLAGAVLGIRRDEEKKEADESGDTSTASSKAPDCH